MEPNSNRRLEKHLVRLREQNNLLNWSIVDRSVRGMIWNAGVEAGYSTGS